MKPQGIPFTKWLQRLGVLAEHQGGLPWAEHIQPVAIVEDISDVQPPQKVATALTCLSRTASASEYSVHQFKAVRTPLYIATLSTDVSTLYRIYIGTADQIDNDKTVITPPTVGGTLDAEVAIGDATAAPDAGWFYKVTGVSGLFMGFFLHPGELMACVRTTAASAFVNSYVVQEVPVQTDPNP